MCWTYVYVIVKIKEYNNFELKILYSLYIINAIEKIFPYQGLAHGIIYALHFVLSPWLALSELCDIYIFGIMGLFFGISDLPCFIKYFNVKFYIDGYI